MKDHGNLYWRIEFWIAASSDAVYEESSRIEVRSYTYSHAFDQASSLYLAALQRGQVVTYFRQYLCEDDSSYASERHFGIYKRWALKNPDDPGSFFESSSERAYCALRCLS